MIILYDTETTGLPNPLGSPLDRQPKIIEFAAIKIDEKLEEVDRIKFLCNPMMQLSDIITKITGLKQEDVENEQTFSFYYPKICEFFLGADTLVAHNLPFDRSLLTFELQRLGKMNAFPWPYKHICTMEKSQHMSRTGKWLKLTDLHQEMTGEEFINGAHRAMNDVEALLRVFKAMRQKELL